MDRLIDDIMRVVARRKKVPLTDRQKLNSWVSLHGLTYTSWMIGVPWLPDSNPILDTSSARVLSSMNDEGKTFEEIADWIEENL